MAAKKKPEEFKILTPRDHVRTRIGMYLGSASKESIERFVMGQWNTVQYVPALIKMIDEIIDNSVDEAIRTDFKFANKIDVTINGDEITVTDNGRGIPQDKVKEETTGKMLPRPVAAWTRTNAGTSFTDDRVTIGTNGVGSAATNFLSSKFIGKTWQKPTCIEVICSDGGLNVQTKTTDCRSGSGTSVTFTPDFSCFECENLAEIDTEKLVLDRLMALQMALPEIKFTFNGKKVIDSRIAVYANLFGETPKVVHRGDDLQFFFGSSEDGWRTNSYVNGVNTRGGGSYVDYVSNGVVDELVGLIKKKMKIEVAKSTIKNGLMLVLFARNFTNPKFDSQTKERLTNPHGEIKKHYDAAFGPEFRKLADKIMATEEIIGPIVEAQLAKKLAADKRAATLAQKKLRKVKVAKHVAASGNDGTLFIVEGDSAMGFLLKVRDPKKVGAFPLRGVIMNTWDMVPAEVLKNKELSELIAVLGLDINDKNSVDNMTYHKIAILTDADHDGEGHIAPLLVAFFAKFWPRLFEDDRVMITRTPIMISSKGKTTRWSYSYDEAQELKTKTSGYSHRYIKGLGSLTEGEYSTIINEPKFDIVELDDVQMLQMMFGSDANPRKEFMLK